MESKLDVAAVTLKGHKRDRNCESVIAEIQPRANGQPHALLMVADGMTSDLASMLAVETVQTCLNRYVQKNKPAVRLRPIDPRDNIVRLHCAFEKANGAIRHFAAANFNAPTTLSASATALFIDGDEALIANVGNCRAYLLRDGVLTQLTHDHSLVAALERIGIVSPDMLYEQPYRSIVTRSLGSKRDVPINVSVTALQPRDSLLLCSNGLWGAVQDEAEFGRILTTAADAKTAANTLINDANNHSGADNISVAIAKVLP